MIAVWMAYAIGIGLLLLGAAAAAEEALRRWGLPSRFVWAAALVASVVLPFGFFRVDAPTISPRAGGATTVDGAAEVAGTVAPTMLSSAFFPPWLDPALLVVWGLGSVLVLGVLLGSTLRLRADARTWRRGQLAGTEVWVSRALGPAAVGLLRGRVVVPEWALELDEESQRLVLAHEREHLRSGDTRLLLGALLAVTVLPWSPGLWWQVRRLREAVEIDCDGRVAQTTGARRRYGELLLLVAGRMIRPPAKAIGLAAASPPLERRIRHLVGAIPEFAPLRLAAASGLAMAALWLFALLPVPPAPSIGALLAGRADRPEISPAVNPAPDARPELLNRHETPLILGRVYPPELREAGIGGTAIMWAYVGVRGTVDDTALLESSGSPELDEAARRALAEFRFRPARVSGVATGVWTQQPVTFVATDRAPSPSQALTRGADAPPMARVAIWSTPAPVVLSMR